MMCLTYGMMEMSQYGMKEMSHLWNDVKCLTCVMKEMSQLWNDGNVSPVE